MRGVTGWLGIAMALSVVGWSLWAPFGGSTDLPVVSTTFGLLPVAVTVGAAAVLIRDVRPWVPAAATYLAAFGAMDATRLPAEAWWVARAGAEVSAWWSATNAVAGLALAVLGVVVVLGERSTQARAPTGWARGVGVGCGIALAVSAVLPWWSTGRRGGLDLALTFFQQPLVFQAASLLGVTVALALAVVSGATRHRGVWLGVVAGLLGTRTLVIGQLLDPARAAADVGPQPAMWVALVAQLGLAVVLVVTLVERGGRQEPVPAP